MIRVISLSSTKVRSGMSDIRYAKCHVRLTYYTYNILTYKYYWSITYKMLYPCIFDNL